MDPKDVIESYVDEVVRRLPPHMRKDVGLELRDLLNEELSDKAEAAGRPADETMALALLNKFGAPDAAAARYRPGGLTIIRGQDARIFSIVAFSGVALQWGVTLLQSVVLPSEGDVWLRLAHWWPTMGLGAFWWPGLMITAAIVAAYVRDRWPTPGPDALTESSPWSPRASMDPDRINRPLWAVVLGLFAVGMVMTAATPALLLNMPEPAREAFALDHGFLYQRAPWLLVLWAAQFAVFVWVLIDGRWKRLTRQLDLALKAAGGALIVWFIAAGPILQNPQVDGFAKLILAVITVIVAIELAVKVRRESMRVGSAPGRAP